MADHTASLEGIPGLDAEAGLRTVGGRLESLLRLLRRYEVLHGGDGARFRDALDRADLEAGHVLAHTLKGAAGFLGLVEIQARAAALEAAFRDPEARELLPGLVDHFDEANARACEGIRHLGPG